MLEKDLEKKFVQAVKDYAGKAYKFVSPGNGGVPDRLVVLPGGRIGFVELKQKGKKPTVLQEKRMQELRALGCFVAVLDDPADIERVIYRLGFAEAEQGANSLLMNLLESGGLA